MEKYYKLYNLIDHKLTSKFGNERYIELNKLYKAQNQNYRLCFASINHILDYEYVFYRDPEYSVRAYDD